MSRKFITVHKLRRFRYSPTHQTGQTISDRPPPAPKSRSETQPKIGLDPKDRNPVLLGRSFRVTALQREHINCMTLGNERTSDIVHQHRIDYRLWVIGIRYEKNSHLGFHSALVALIQLVNQVTCLSKKASFMFFCAQQEGASRASSADKVIEFEVPVEEICQYMPLTPPGLEMIF